MSALFLAAAAGGDGGAAAPPSTAAPADAAGAAPAAVAAAGEAPLVIDGTGGLHRAVTGASPEAQRWFDQGLALVYGFNHDEAGKDFAYAARLSPGCAMCFWGVAYANGPHINNPAVTAGAAKDATFAVKQAQAAAAQATPVEQALIEALAQRYRDPQPKDRARLDKAYAEAMRRVRKRFPRDADVLALTAEALMDLHPWDYYGNDGRARRWTAEIIAIAEAALRLDARHPLANHVLIHAVEASGHPERADRAAEVLRDLQPGLGHMVHMPSHIDVRTGRWEQAILANRRAIAADDAYRARVTSLGFYKVYIAHNHQMLAYAAMMSGRSAEAFEGAKQALSSAPAELSKEEAAFADGYFALPLEVAMRFGRWEEILAAPEFDASRPASRALRHAARGVAFAAQGKVQEARAEEVAFAGARKAVPKEWMMGNSSMNDVLEVAAHLLAGEVLYRGGEEARGLVELRRAVAAEDRLIYDEPPDWLQPTRHALGAALLQSGKLREAEAVFREDLRRVPENGWGLFGLSRALSLQHKGAEATKIQARFDKVWSKADVQITSACFCQSGV